MARLPTERSCRKNRKRTCITFEAPNSGPIDGVVPNAEFSGMRCLSAF